MPTIAIIIPCYNEEKRLSGSLLAGLIDAMPDALLYLVNDGSRDRTLPLLHALAAAHPGKITVLSLAENQGKAKAIEEGVREILSRSSPDYIGYMDADLSTPVLEFNNLYTTIVREKAGFILGSRIKKLNSGINRSLIRHFAGRCVATFIDSRFDLGIYDTQCGAKIFSRAVIDIAFGEAFLTDWLFDAEIFIRLKKNNLLHTGIELPITGWKHVSGSKVGLMTLPRLLAECLLLSRKY